MAAVALLAALAGGPRRRVRVLAYAVIVLLVIDPFLLHSVAIPAVVRARARASRSVRRRSRRAFPVPAGCASRSRCRSPPSSACCPVLALRLRDVPARHARSPTCSPRPRPKALGVYGLRRERGRGGVAPPLGPLLQQPTALLVTWVTRSRRAAPARADRRCALDTRVGAAACRRLRRSAAAGASVACA